MHKKVDSKLIPNNVKPQHHEIPYGNSDHQSRITQTYLLTMA